MTNEDERLLRHCHDLAGRALEQGRVLFTGFLTPAEQSLLLTHREEFGYCPMALFGGTDGCERQMAAFGEDAESAAFPIACVLISPRQQKFADALTHRDFLGAVMSLGLERSCVGDILVRENAGLVLCTEAMAPYLAQNIESVCHTAVACAVTGEVPDSLRPTLREETVQAASARADAVLARLYRLSREEANDLFAQKKVFVNARVTENNSYILKPGDTVSVRGHGKFVFDGVQSLSKKGKANCAVRVYV